MYKVTWTSSKFIYTLERDGLDRYFVDNKWGYREIVKEQEEEPVEQGDQDERTSGK